MPDTATVTVLFTDVVGSTQLRTSRGDESAHRILQAHEELVRREIEKSSGQEVKTIGDSFMVAFGSARGAVDCAVAVQHEVEEYNRNNPDQLLEVRIGLNTGEAIREKSDLYGAAVDAAARIMSKAAGGQILVSGAVRSVVGEEKDIMFTDRGPFWLKGFPERWRLYEVLWQEEKISTIPAAPRIAERTPFVGRENERADLRRFLEGARGGHGSLVMIGGEPGVGKTRITEELVADARRHGFLTLTGHCYEMEGAPPYIPFIEILQSIMRVVEPDTLFGTLGDAAPEAAKLVPELRQQFPDIPDPRKLPPEQERLFLFNNLRDFFERLANQRPVLMVIEDLHWTDEATVLLLQHIAQRLRDMPVLVVGTYRDTELDVARSLANALKELFRQRLAHDLLLKRLPVDGVTAMLRGRSGQEPPPRLVEVIYQETEGNPFFVEEVFKHLAEEGKLFDADGQWQGDLRIDELDVPRGVLLVIGHRLERVTQECKRALTTAAVIRHAFGFQLLEKLIDLGDDAVFDAIDEAERAQLIRSTTRGSEARLMFSHELIRQTLLSDLSTPRRQRLHLRVAEAMELLYGNALQQHAADLAYHFYQGGANAEKIIEYAVMAAERATAQTAYEDAVAQYERALQALEQQEPVDEFRRCNLLLALGRAYGNAGDPDHAKETLSGVTDIAWKHPAPRQFGEAVLGLFQFLWIAGTVDDRLLSLMDEALALLPAEDDAIRASIMGCLSKALALVEDKRCVALSEQAIAMTRRIGDPGALCHALVARIWVWDRPLMDRISDAIEFTGLVKKIGFFNVGGNEGRELLY
ncbi:MAG: AAA family ATPase, partial [Candidatus Hydrogenedentota bacterium]